MRVAQKSCRWLNLGNIEGQDGQGSEQPNLVEDDLAHCGSLDWMTCKVPVQAKLFYDSIFPCLWLFPVSIPWQHLDLELFFRKIHIFPPNSFSWQPLFSSCPTGRRYLPSLRCSVSAVGGLRLQEISVPWGHIQCPGVLQLHTCGDSHYRGKLISFL